MLPITVVLIRLGGSVADLSNLPGCRRQGDPLLFVWTLRLHLERCDWPAAGGEKAPDKWAWLCLANQQAPSVFRRQGEWAHGPAPLFTECFG